MPSSQAGIGQLGTFQLGGAALAPIPGTLSMGVLGPHRSFPNPKVAGPLTIPTLIGPRALYAPVVKLAQTVTMGALAGPRALPGPRVSLVKTLTMGALTGPRALYAPTVTGGPQYVRLLPITGPRRLYAPAVDGGLQDCRIYLGRTDVTQYFDWGDGTCSVTSQSLGRWKAAFAFNVRTGLVVFQPVLGQTVLIVDHGFRVFAGCITEVKIERYMSTALEIRYFCQATDKSGIADHRVVTGKTYAAGTSTYSVIADLVGSFMNGEGVTLNGVPSDGTLGTLAAPLICNFETVTSAFDKVARDTGTVWWIEVDGALHFSPLASLPAAPFDLTETGGQWRNLITTKTTTDYYNKLYCVSNLNILPGSGSSGSGSAGAGVTETFTWNPDNPGVDTITNGSGVRVAVGIRCSTPLGAVSNLTVAGVVQTVVDFGAYAGQVPSGTDLLWLFGGPATGNPGPTARPTTLPTAGQAISITYTPAVSTSSSVAQYGTALAPADPHGDPLGTCGSGIFEGVIQVQNISRQEDLNAIALSELNRIGGVPTVVDYETDHHGLVPGQKQMANVPLSGLPNVAMLITQLSGVMIPPRLATGYAFRWTVQARSNLDPGNSVKWFERLVGRTANALPVLQDESPVFVLGAGSSVSAGVSLTNPYIVSRTGKLIELLASWSTPAVDENLVLTLTRNGATIASVTLLHTTAANALVSYQIPITSVIYLYARDVLNVTAAYSVTGSAPVRAAGVTFKARLAI